MSKDIVCSVVVPLYNEEEVILETYKRLKGVMDAINEPYEIIFVNDGSKIKQLLWSMSCAIRIKPLSL